MRILIVDDNPIIAETLGLTLSQSGYDVEAFSDPEAALAALMIEPASVLITGNNMQAMSGAELANRVSDCWPACRVIILSEKRPVQPAGRLQFDWLPYEILYGPLDPNDLLFVIARIQRDAA